MTPLKSRQVLTPTEKAQAGLVLMNEAILELPAQYVDGLALAAFAGGNPPIDLRSGFSPSVVRKFVQRERMLPVMCFTTSAMEFASGSKVAYSCSSVAWAMAASASFLYWRKTVKESVRWEAVKLRAMS
jgi:hypothetical protein